MKKIAGFLIAATLFCNGCGNSSSPAENAEQPTTSSGKSSGKKTKKETKPLSRSDVRLFYERLQMSMAGRKSIPLAGFQLSVALAELYKLDRVEIISGNIFLKYYDLFFQLGELKKLTSDELDSVCVRINQEMSDL